MYSKDLFKILNNLGFQIINDPIFGEIIQMSASDAYVFSATTGAKYLLYQNGITMKGRDEVFIHRSLFSNGHLIYSPGLFSRNKSGFLREGDSADNLKIKYPSVFFGPKKLIVLDVDKSKYIEKDVYNKIISFNLNPNDYLLYKNFNSKNTGESFLEYLAIHFFVEKGYICENQTPWFQQKFKYKSASLNGGIPDFSAFVSSALVILQKLGITNDDKGVPICLIPVYKNFYDFQIKDTSPQKSEYRLLIGEAKTTKNSIDAASIQLLRAQEVDLASELFTITPDTKSDITYGSFFVEDGICKYKKQSATFTTNVKHINEDDMWTKTYIKLLILGNLHFNDVLNLIGSYRTANNLSSIENYEERHLLDAVQNISDDDFINYVKGVIR